MLQVPDKVIAPARYYAGKRLAFLADGHTPFLQADSLRLRFSAVHLLHTRL